MGRYTEDDLKKSQKEPRDELGVKVLNTFYDPDSGLPEYDRLKAELNSLEDKQSNSTKDYHRLCNEISGMETTVDQLQLTIKGSKDEKAKLELQKIILQNFVKDFRDNNIEYNKVKQAIKGEVEFVLYEVEELELQE